MNDGGPAFPVDSYISADGHRWESKLQGISVRDLAALLAMQVIIPITFEAMNNADDVLEKAKLLSGIPPSAYEIADLMLKERNKKP